MKDTKWRLNHKIGNYTTMLADKAGGSAGSSNTVRVKDIILDNSL